MFSQNQFKISQPLFMASESDINSSIIKMTMTLQENYSKLLKYTGEIIITIPNSGIPVITINTITNTNNVGAQLLKKHNEDNECEGK